MAAGICGVWKKRGKLNNYKTSSSSLSKQLNTRFDARVNCSLANKIINQQIITK